MNGTTAIHRTSVGEAAPRRSRLALNGPLGISLVALIVVGSIVFAGLATLLSTFALSLGHDDPVAVFAELKEEHERKIVEDKERFIGRSVFFKPPAPRAPTPVVRDIPKPVDLPIPPPPGPSPTYTGPSIIYALGDAICFRGVGQNDKQFVVRVGEEKNGVQVISMNLPWSARLGHAGGEYDVQIFKPMDEAKYLPTQPRPTAVVKGLIEVPPPEMKVPALEAGDDQQVIEAAAAAENVDRARQARRQGRPVAAPAGRTPPPDRETARAQAQESGEANDDEEAEAADEPAEDDSIAEDEDEPIEDEEPLDEDEENEGEVDEEPADEGGTVADPKPAPQAPPQPQRPR